MGLLGRSRVGGGNLTDGQVVGGWVDATPRSGHVEDLVEVSRPAGVVVPLGEAYVLARQGHILVSERGILKTNAELTVELPLLHIWI